MAEQLPGPTTGLSTAPWTEPLNAWQVCLESPGQADVLALIAALDAYQDTLYPPESRYALDLGAVPPGRMLLVVARHPAGQAVGCGAVVLGVADESGDVGASAGELKRMFLRPESRGQGVAAAILMLLESEAWQAGCRQLLLETGPRQPEALAFYARNGYQRCGRFSTYRDDPLSVFMHKHLVDPQPQPHAHPRPHPKHKDAG